MRKNKFAFLFLLTSFILLFINLLIIVIFSYFEMKSTFYDALNVSSLVIAFISFIASSFFSVSVYIQAKNQNKINESLPKKDDQYIIANYSLFNIEKEISFFSLNEVENSNVIATKKYLNLDQHKDCDNITRLVFLPTDSVNMPTYKVLVRSVEFISAQKRVLFNATALDVLDGSYSANILDRGYNCISIDILSDIKTIQSVFNSTDCLVLGLDIISVFNVKMSVSFYIYLNSVKDISENPDKNIIPDLTTYTIHHTNYQIEDKSILTFDTNGK